MDAVSRAAKQELQDSPEAPKAAPAAAPTGGSNDNKDSPKAPEAAPAAAPTGGSNDNKAGSCNCAPQNGCGVAVCSRFGALHPCAPSMPASMGHCTNQDRAHFAERGRVGTHAAASRRSKRTRRLRQMLRSTPRLGWALTGTGGYTRGNPRPRKPRRKNERRREDIADNLRRISSSGSADAWLGALLRCRYRLEGRKLALWKLQCRLPGKDLVVPLDGTSMYGSL